MGISRDVEYTCEPRMRRADPAFRFFVCFPSRGRRRLPQLALLSSHALVALCFALVSVRAYVLFLRTAAAANRSRPISLTLYRL
jgi:hypothetical protein